MLEPVTNQGCDWVHTQYAREGSVDPYGCALLIEPPFEVSLVIPQRPPLDELPRLGSLHTYIESHDVQQGRTQRARHPELLHSSAGQSSVALLMQFSTRPQPQPDLKALFAHGDESWLYQCLL